VTSPVQHRRGVTLIELLVVIAILGLLAVTVIPNLSNTGERRKAREAARAVSAFVAAGQSRSLATRGGAGIWIDVLPAAVTNAANIAVPIAIDLAAADVGDPYAGDTTTAGITTLSVASSGSSATAAFSGGCTPPSASGNLIRLGGQPTLFTFTWANSTTGTIFLRASQNPDNTGWPRVPPGGLSYEIIGPPTRASTGGLTLENGVAIDLYHSTWAAQSLSTSLASACGGTLPGSFQVLFDATGCPQTIVAGSYRFQLVDPLYLLVAPIESIQNSGGLAPTDGYWIAVDPRGGVPKVAEVVTSGTDFARQQAFIRSGAGTLGR